MRQRVVIAIALSCDPQILIADEPTTALDVTIQAQILELMRELQERLGMSIILITHDLGVVAGVCDRTNVMYAGEFVETAPTIELFGRPRHPYTLGLLRSVPRLDAARKEKLHPIGGIPPDLRSLPDACSFAPRCAYATQESVEKRPALRQIDGPKHFVACWNPVPVEDMPAAREETA
jgi:oligopeptide transport system ATP-binding protein